MCSGRGEPGLGVAAVGVWAQPSHLLRTYVPCDEVAGEGRSDRGKKVSAGEGEPT